MDELFKLVGLGTPFLYAGGTYAFFHWLDVNASDEAKAALSRLLSFKEYDRINVSSAVVQAFDRVYTHPLGTLRAFLRSAIITTLISAVVSYELWYLFTTEGAVKWMFEHKALYVVIMSLMLAVTCITDYLFLFIIRRWLVVFSRRPIVSLLASSLIFILVFQVASFSREIITRLVLISDLPGPETFGVLVLSDLYFYFSGVVVFAWMPIMGLSLLVIRLFNLLIPAVSKVQWFLKDGKDHPLIAVGYVAAAIVFLFAVGLRLFLLPSITMRS